MKMWCVLIFVLLLVLALSFKNIVKYFAQRKLVETNSQTEIYNKISAYITAKKHSDATDEDVLFWCIRRGMFPQISLMLIEKGCRLALVENSLLRMNVETGSIKIVEYLISLGCDPTFNNNEMLWRAAFNDNSDIIKYLIKVGCEPTISDLQEILERLSVTSGKGIVEYFLGVFTKRNQYNCFENDIIHKSHLELLHPKIIRSKLLLKEKMLKVILKPMSLHMQLTSIE
jgi:hypothetical protein